MTVINLRQARKDRDRAAKRAKGDANAAKFGQSKAEKALTRAETDQSRRHLDGHRLEGPSGDSKDD